MRYEIRAATTADQAQLYRLAEHLDSVNLPHDAAEIAEILETSEASFSGAIADARKRRFVFVLRDLQEGVAVGTSMVIAQLGSRDAPYVFFDVRNEERYSASVDKHFIHEVLTIGYSFHGPTEIGGLVVHPEYRKDPKRLGMLISYVRFLFLATHREQFQPRVLAELMPPLEPDGTSHLWEAVGRHFTGMTYRAADRLSKKNKEFISGLFPRGDIYTSLLPPQAQAVIGEVGPQTRGVEKMLTRIGFRYWRRVDPFDGGPHFIAPTDEIELVQRTSRRRLIAGTPEGESARRCLIARIDERPPWFRAVAARATLHPEHPEQILVERSALDHLDLQDGDIAPVLPLF
ncbi:MAG: arginine N-succinyltransferase [Sandaracinaceae bacterium]|nr:arginine N-succinyltransferase [Myxococcales bacterium]